MTTDTSKITCIVTIHGIGFQQPPDKGVDGYADDLHARLCAALNQHGIVLLSDDPDRDFAKHTEERKNTSVPIYVSSIWPDEKDILRREEGLMRLGSWKDDGRVEITHDRTEKPNQALVKGDASIAHVALVYSDLEGDASQLEVAIEAANMALIYSRHYTNFNGLLKKVIQDTKPLLPLIWEKIVSIWKRPPEPALTPSLRVRQDNSHRNRHHSIGDTQYPSGFKALVRQLENDVAAYVCHNAERQRIRNFVLDALLRLAFRCDVSNIILNTHSNGTLIAIDVLQELPPIAASKISAIITAGSPIRKYVDFFQWGKHLAVSPEVVEYWFNFYDEKDFVADPLYPRANWRVEEELKEKDLTGIYKTFNLASGEPGSIHIIDRKVNNIKHSQGSGLKAHNYWDNTQEFICVVAEIVKSVRDNTPILVEASPLPSPKERKNKILRYFIG